MDRRTALRALASGAMGTAAAGSWVDTLAALSREQAHRHAGQAAAAAQDWTPKVLDPQQNGLVVTLTELIIPETDTPGARGAQVNRFVDRVLQQAELPERTRFLEGLAWIDRLSQALFKTGFLEADASQQTALLTRLSTDGNPDREETAGREFFEILKSMTIDGYYSSEIGLRQELGDSGQLFLPKFPGCNHPQHS